MSGGSIEVVGLSGCGKSTISRCISAELQIPVLDFADLLLEVRNDGNVHDHDSILEWRPGELDGAVRRVQRLLSERSKRGLVYVLETHICPNIPGEGFRPTPPEILLSRRPKGIIVIKTEYEELLKYRNARGAARDGRTLCREQFDLEWHATFAAAISLSSYASIPCFVHTNKEGTLTNDLPRLCLVAQQMVNAEVS